MLFANLNLSADQEKFVTLLDNSSSTSRHCLTSALQHLNDGVALRMSHPHLAMFSAITAEEEAATALLRLLKEKAYQHADKLNHWSHPHKHAVYPFVRVVQQLIAEIIASGLDVRLASKVIDGQIRLTSVILNLVEIDGEPIALTPYPPLNFDVSVDNRFIDLRPRLSKLLDTNETAIYREIASSANERNVLLYASESHARQSRVVPRGYFSEKASRVLSMLIVYLLIEPYTEQSPIVQSVLGEFLRIMEKGTRRGKIPKSEDLCAATSPLAA